MPGVRISPWYYTNPKLLLSVYNYMELPANINTCRPFELIKDELALVRHQIANQLKMLPFGEHSGLNGDKASYFMKHVCSGKMLRPGLVLLSGLACGGIGEEHIRLGAVVEMIHNATLLHDDVIDDGQRRRGRATINNVWGNEAAVLLGDFLLSRVFRMVADTQEQTAKSIAATTVRICEGELRQISQRRNWSMTEDEYFEIIRDKSASLFSTCCGLGARLAGAEDWRVKSLENFGLYSGMAFQITDDILDITGHEKIMGKSPGNDAAEMKPTLAIIHLLMNARPDRRKQVIERLENNTDGNDHNVVSILKEYGSIEYSRATAKSYVQKALSSLDGIDKGQAGRALAETARFTANREV